MTRADLGGGEKNKLHSNIKANTDKGTALRVLGQHTNRKSAVKYVQP